MRLVGDRHVGRALGRLPRLTAYSWAELILLGAGLVGLALVLAMRLRGEPVKATSRLPLGTLMALAAWPVWLVIAFT